MTTAFHIGDLAIDTPALLAPMAAVTDLPFRTIVEEFGVGLTITEFLSANAIENGDEKTVAKMTASLHGRRFGVQIFGRERRPMQNAAKLAVATGASLVDINMGCPAKRVVAGACGSALMREPEVAQEMVHAVREAVGDNIPVSVKHRAGWDHNSMNAPEFACAMVEAGAKMITVHGRTRSQGFSGSSDNSVIRRVRAAVPRAIPVVGNGDVVDLQGFLRMREETGCDAVMIGRGALGNPWLFRDIGAWHRGERPKGGPSLLERMDVFCRHLELILKLKSGPKLVHEVRKASAWYAKGLYGANRLRAQIWATGDVHEIERMVQEFFDSLLHRDDVAA